MHAHSLQIALLCILCLFLAPPPPPLALHPATRFPRSSSSPLSINASTLLAASHFSSAFASSPTFSPHDSLFHALALTNFPPPLALSCIALSGGLSIVGDSNARNLASHLLQAQGRNRIPVLGVPWDSQRADEAFQSTSIHFRFARNAWPLLARATEDAVLGLGARVVVAHSAFWDMNSDTGITDADWLQIWQRKIARYLVWVREVLVPAAAAADAARPSAAPPLRFFFRDANPTVWEMMDEGRQRFMTTGRVHAMNAFLRAALASEAAEPGGVAWQLLETGPLMPLHQLREFVGDDGYHASEGTNELLMQLLLNALCAPRVTAATLSELAGSDADPWRP